ncbi:transposase [Desulfobacter latus]|uniref:Transposase n=2 Tax=Desulfobacter latus TaxID=2292 RepID=A0A850T9X4_9BACT|nr:transposase [Desulfobacter latus]
MIDSVPKLSVSQIVRRLKQQSTKKVWDAFPKLEKHFWKNKASRYLT